MSTVLLILIIVAIVACIVFFVGWILPQKKVNPEEMSEYGRMLIKRIKEAGERGVMIERNYEYSNGAMPPVFYKGHCYSRAVGVEFNPKSGWWIKYADQGGCYSLTRDHLWPSTTEDNIKVCTNQDREPSIFKVHEMIKE